MPRSAAALRMSRVLERRAEAEGGYAPLARAIREAYLAAFPDEPEPEREVVDRRKLAVIVKGSRELVFTSRELRAIDVYLEPFGEGLSTQPLFEKPNLIQTLAGSRTTTFLLGSRPGEEGVNFPHWDVLAMAEIQRRLTALQMPVTVSIRDVPMPPNDESAALHESVDVEDEERWAGLFGEPGIALVCMGSNRTMPASGRMLGSMFDLEHLPEEVELPFRFVWSEHLVAGTSRFRMPVSELEALGSESAAAAAEAVRAGQGSALVLSDRVLLDTLTGRRKGRGYGVCVAQRRANGAVWLLLAGVSGPATYATARIAHRLSMRLGDPRRGAASPVWWSVVAAEVPESHEGRIDRLRDLNPRIEVEPRAWRPRP